MCVKRIYGDFEYQAVSWDTPWRVVAKVEWHPGELFPSVGFLVTNLPMEPNQVTVTCVTGASKPMRHTMPINKPYDLQFPLIRATPGVHAATVTRYAFAATPKGIDSWPVAPIVVNGRCQPAKFEVWAIALYKLPEDERPAILAQMSEDLRKATQDFLPEVIEWHLARAGRKRG